MQSELKNIHEDIEQIKKSIDFIKNILAEKQELSKSAKEQLQVAEKTNISEYVDHSEVKKKLLR